MLNYERRAKIKQLLIKNGVVSLQELQRLFPNVTIMTLRRDLEYMETINVAKRIRGGAKLISQFNRDTEEVYSLRETENFPAKNKIAKTAVEVIKKDHSLFLDSGSTCMQLAKIIPDHSMSIITSGPNVALELCRRVDISVTLIGGTINMKNLSVSGMQAMEFIKGVNFETAVLVPSGYSDKNGFSCGNYAECELKKEIIRKAKKVVILMDTSKNEKDMPYTFALMKDINVLVTEQEPDETILSRAKENNVAVVYE